jgi:hypothetical protein
MWCHTSSVTYLSGKFCIEIFQTTHSRELYFARSSESKNSVENEFQINWGFSFCCLIGTVKMLFGIFISEKKKYWKLQKLLIYRHQFDKIFLPGSIFHVLFEAMQLECIKNGSSELFHDTWMLKQFSCRRKSLRKIIWVCFENALIVSRQPLGCFFFSGKRKVDQL